MKKNYPDTEETKISQIKDKRQDKACQEVDFIPRIQRTWKGIYWEELLESFEENISVLKTRGICWCITEKNGIITALLKP